MSFTFRENEVSRKHPLLISIDAKEAYILNKHFQDYPKNLGHKSQSTRKKRYKERRRRPCSSICKGIQPDFIVSTLPQDQRSFVSVPSNIKKTPLYLCSVPRFGFPLEQELYARAVKIQRWWRKAWRNIQSEAATYIQRMLRSRHARKQLKAVRERFEKCQKLFNESQVKNRRRLFFVWQRNAHRNFEMRVFSIRVRQVFNKNLLECVMYRYRNVVKKAVAKKARIVSHFRKWMLGNHIQSSFTEWREYTTIKASLRKFRERRSWSHWIMFHKAFVIEKEKVRREEAATYLQHYWRRRFRMAQNMTLKVQRWNAATNIQRMMRGFFGRKRWKSRLIALYIVEHILAKTYAAHDFTKSSTLLSQRTNIEQTRQDQEDRYIAEKLTECQQSLKNAIVSAQDCLKRGKAKHIYLMEACLLASFSNLKEANQLYKVLASRVDNIFSFPWQKKKQDRIKKDAYSHLLDDQLKRIKTKARLTFRRMNPPPYECPCIDCGLAFGTLDAAEAHSIAFCHFGEIKQNYCSSVEHITLGNRDYYENIDFVQMLEELLRDNRVLYGDNVRDRFATKIQKTWRGYYDRLGYRVRQKFADEWYAYDHMEERKRESSSSKIQKTYRGWRARKFYGEVLDFRDEIDGYMAMEENFEYSLGVDNIAKLEEGGAKTTIMSTRGAERHEAEQREFDETIYSQWKEEEYHKYIYK